MGGWLQPEILLLVIVDHPENYLKKNTSFNALRHISWTVEELDRTTGLKPKVCALLETKTDSLW